MSSPINFVRAVGGLIAKGGRTDSQSLSAFQVQLPTPSFTCSRFSEDGTEKAEKSSEAGQTLGFALAKGLIGGLTRCPNPPSRF